MAKIESVTGFDNGVIWLLDHRANRLECSWVRTPVFAGKRYDIVLPVSGNSFAARVFQNGQNGDSKCREDDPLLDRIAHEALKARGEITGVRLESGGRASGVLVVWSSGNGKHEPREQARLKDLAAPIALRLSYSRRLAQRWGFEQDLGQLLRNMQGRPDLDRIFLPILQQILKLGFDTARAFEYREEERPETSSFHLIRAAPRMIELPPIVLHENRWAMELQRRAIDAIRRGEVCLPRQRVDSDEMPNPVSLLLNRKPGTPWIEIPLIVNGRFYGYIAADGCRDISEEQLDELALLGVLAAQALAPAQMLSAQLNLMDHVLHKALQPSAGSNEELQVLVREGDLIHLADCLIQDNAYLKRIKRRAIQALNILRHGDLQRERFLVRGAVEAAILEFEAELPEARKRLVALSSDLRGDDEIDGIKMEIESAVDNMLTNAFNASPRKPIEVRLSRDHDVISITAVRLKVEQDQLVAGIG